MTKAESDTPYPTEKLSSPSATTPRESDQKGKAVGILPDGSRFVVPETFDVMRSLLSMRSWRSPGTLVWIGQAALLVACLPLYYLGFLPRWYFVVQFIFWRLAYNAGLGFFLKTQSEHGWFVQRFKLWIQSHPNYKKMLEATVVLQEASYNYDAYPLEFNAWMAFRCLVMIILANDLVSYFEVVLVYWQMPNLFNPLDWVCYVLGVGLILFALWSKADAHRVIGDYAWYWGDFFFLLDKNLVFDGIFQMFPHPMYSVGYAFMYGFSLMAKSQVVFFMSILGHLSQIVFLILVENPHIDKTYNTLSHLSEEEMERERLLYDGDVGCMDHGDLVILKNFNPFRATDLCLAFLLSYACVVGLLLPSLTFHVLHYVMWRTVLTGGLGYLLRRQSMDEYLTKKFKSNKAAFQEWKKIYNVAVVMTNAVFVVLVVRLTLQPGPFTLTSHRFLAAIVGFLLIGFNLYVTRSMFVTLGTFGYFYGDFFRTDIPPSLKYSGIYRYLNNPDSSLGLAAYYGAVFLSGDFLLLLPLVIATHAAVKLFEHFVEKPHMKKLYGRQLRPVGGLEAEIEKLSESFKQKTAKYERVLRRIGADLSPNRRGQLLQGKPKED